MAIGLQFINGDFVISGNKLQFVGGIEKTKRDFRKFLLTDTESPDNKTLYFRYNPNYGTDINKLNSYKDLSQRAILDLMELKLDRALKYYVSLQETRKNLSAGEVITDIASTVYQDLYNQQKINFQILVAVATGESTTLNFQQGT